MIETLFSNVYIVLGGAALIGIAGYFTWKALMRPRVVAAATEFRIAIDTPDFVGLRGAELRAALNEAFPAHSEAARDLHRHLGLFDRIRFDKAWNDYHGGSEKYPDFAPYYVRGNGPDLLAQRLGALRDIASQWT
jgi:hypothetical protein